MSSNCASRSRRRPSRARSASGPAPPAASRSRADPYPRAGPRPAAGPAGRPVTETDDAYLVEIDLPGVERKDLTVEVAGDELRVSGEIVEKEKVGWLRHRTRRVGQFSYRTLLPGGIDAEHISADLADGVLSVRVPKSETAKPRRITVNAG
ncbi:Hsp20/alpha crystallin family protein [Actinoplanes sp. NPDC051343]|uniref:Hsp20/alpha crystallin family protein n=1 Tax=Actinoplanes sp. NPDC051343 TaxID=3363906 RepID=UPI0037B0207F